MKFKKVFRIMTVRWPDDDSFALINFSLLGSFKEENIFGKIKMDDERSLDGKKGSWHRPEGQMF